MRGSTSYTLRIISAQPLEGILRSSSLEYPERMRPKTRLLDLASVGVGIEAVVSDRDLTLIRNMGGDPGDELQVIHPLGLIVPFAIAVADLACPFIEGEPLQGKNGTDHVFSHPLGLGLCPSALGHQEMESVSRRYAIPSIGNFS